MAAQRLVQAFPPGMVAPPAPASGLAVDELAFVRRRRRELLTKIAGLSTHSHRRAELLGRLREVTAEELRLECARRPR